ncbi:Thiamine-monophosphate kinase [Hyella patelloides LEGE 07179]|uniref:Thiamine-monophosphate kinase n=1 Tax=Hyella patelloides LEGE 07179 TaxID=945734 RepID=A0A563VSH5_9CYAN|nr:thiamine-phosphate kinase [Hyella patelloides]VEP14249.1 Thiamine-monophosphate kinase [Hyella patelloides LEGE 07179]
MNNQLVRDLGEQGLLQKIQPFCPLGVIGDDGAVIDIKTDYQLVVTTDVLVDRVHFSDRTTSAFDVGWRSAAANLSDLAAMGANPLGITVGLSLPGVTSVAWVEELYQGLHSCLQQFDTPIVGGDITRSDVITVAITAFGEVLPRQVISRSGARTGDVILITGYHGLSRAGLELLLNPQLKEALNPKERALLIKAHQRPQPRLDVIAKLRKIASDAVVTGMDSSDGLGDAIAKICRCSGVGAVIESHSIPRCPTLNKLSSDCPTEQWILDGGEDFELVLCLASQLAQELLSDLGEGAAIIGHIRDESRIRINGTQEIRERDISDLSAGFQHFSI